MTQTIFLLSEDGELREMSLTSYLTEDVLQRLLAEHPSVLSSVHGEGREGQEWLLVAREAGVPGEEGGSDRWSLDHLFLDRDGVPTLIEVKRSSDTRIRREVVGQMLDYAANSVTYWPIEKVQMFFAETVKARSSDADPDVALDAFLGDEQSPIDFWEDVKTNLQAGRIRLVFVADQIPKELQRIIEFLNDQMDPAEVLAIEVKQYVGEGQRSLVPSLIGRTARAEGRKRSGTPSERRKWTEATFFERAEKQLSAEGLAALRELYEFSREHADRVTFGTGGKSASFNPKFDSISRRSLYTVSASNQLSFNFAWIDDETGAHAKHRLQVFLAELGVDVPEDAGERYIYVPEELWTGHLDKLKRAIYEAISRP